MFARACSHEGKGNSGKRCVVGSREWCRAKDAEGSQGLTRKNFARVSERVPERESWKLCGEVSEGWWRELGARVVRTEAKVEEGLSSK